VDKGNAKNYNYGSNNSGDMDNNSARDSNSSDSNEGNKAYRYIGQRGLLAPISGELKLKRTVKYCL